jgi:hypothetical protein
MQNISRLIDRYIGHLIGQCITLGFLEDRALASEAKLLVGQFLEWVAARPRSDRELREAWSSTCPLTCAWEDAIAEDLVRRGADGHLALTEEGQRRLAVLQSPAPLPGEVP